MKHLDDDFGTYLTLIDHLLTMSNLLVVGKEIHISFDIDSIYLRKSFDSIYMCLNQRTKALIQLVCITTDRVRYKIFTNVVTVCNIKVFRENWKRQITCRFSTTTYVIFKQFLRIFK